MEADDQVHDEELGLHPDEHLRLVVGAPGHHRERLVRLRLDFPLHVAVGVQPRLGVLLAIDVALQRRERPADLALAVQLRDLGVLDLLQVEQLAQLLELLEVAVLVAIARLAVIELAATRRSSVEVGHRQPLLHLVRTGRFPRRLLLVEALERRGRSAPDFALRAGQRLQVLRH